MAEKLPTQAQIQVFWNSIKPTTVEDWTRSDQYFNSFLIPKDDVLDAVLANIAKQGLPDMNVTKAQAKFLNLLAKSIGAKRILEVGTLGGYSTVWFARALPEDGKIVTLELSPHHAKVAQENFKIAGVDHKVTVKVGPGVESLAQLHPEVPFDLVFIDADKRSNVAYFTEAKRLVRKGGVIIVDNVVWFGRVADPEYVANPEYGDEFVEGTRNLLKAIQADEEVDATTISTVGEKNYDGFLYAVKK